MINPHQLRIDVASEVKAKAKASLISSLFSVEILLFYFDIH